MSWDDVPGLIGGILCFVFAWAAIKWWEDWRLPDRSHITYVEGPEIVVRPQRETPRGAASQRADRLGAFVENIDMTTLFDRDGWQCGICKQPIDPKLRHPNRMAGTLDHIIPLNQGGQHHYGNAQAAHYACNSAKGDRTTSADLARYRAMNGDG